MGLGTFIREQALAEGFGAVGFARAGPVPGRILEKWIGLGCHGEMGYMSRSPERRLDPRLVLEGAATVVSMLYPYPHSPAVDPGESRKGIVARYALGKDYHLILEKKLGKILRNLREAFPQVNGKAYVDYGPVCETYWAWQAGLGWIGKNSLLLSRDFGSWFFLSEILLDLVIEPGIPSADYCGSCTACIDACPTGAIIEPGMVDARRCISYLTIEHRSAIPEEFRQAFGNRIFGCDICQEVCPWNRKVSEVTDPQLAPVPRNYDLDLLASLSREEFLELFRKSPVRRAGWEGFRRNVAVALKNTD